MRNNNCDNTSFGLILAESEFEKILGIHIDNKLNLKEHVQRVTR